MARVGRPLIYNNCLDLEAACDLYFEKCDEGTVFLAFGEEGQAPKEYRKPIPYTVPGLCDELGFAERTTLWEYEQRPEFSYIIKRAKQRIERQRAESLVTTEKNPAGKIFDLKANFGWRDTFPEERQASYAVQILLGGSEVKAQIVGQTCHELPEACEDSCLEGEFRQVVATK